MVRARIFGQLRELKYSGNRQRHQREQMGHTTTKARDDFRPKVKQLLAERVNFHCSLCDAPTLGPKAGTADERFNVGKAAHIKAAAKGGPRYDASQTPAERAAIENGLWACATCADIIDRDEASYSVDELHRIKADAEWLASKRAGMPPGSDLPGLQNPNAIKRAVDAFCQGEALRQERIDPRFKVVVRMGTAGPVHEVTAKERVDGQLIVTATDAKPKIEALRDFFHYGGSEVFDGEDLRLEGSPLFKTDDVAAVRWQLSSASREVTVTVALNEAAGTPLFIEFRGTGTQGSKGARLKGSAFGGMLTATLTLDYAGTLTDFRLDCDIQQWAAKPVRRLPDFARLQQIFQVLASPAELRLQCTHDGLESEFGTGVIDGSDKFRALRAIIEEIANLRRLDSFFNMNLELPGDVNEVLRNRTDMSWLLRLIDLDASRETEIPWTTVPTVEQLADLKALVAAKEPEAKTFSYHVHLELYGRTYGPFDVEVSCPAAIYVAIGPTNIEAGIPVEIAMRAVSGTHWSSRSIGPALTA